jgi:hypothetical protein
MIDPAEAVKGFLVTAGVGVFAAPTGWSIHIGALPESPDTAILVNMTGGRSPFPHLALNYPSVQVIVRGSRSGYVPARQRMNMVVEALLGMSSIDVSGDTYRSCNQVGDVSFLGLDDNTRPLFGSNWWFIVLPAVGAGHRVAI